MLNTDIGPPELTLIVAAVLIAMMPVIGMYRIAQKAGYSSAISVL